MSHPRGARHNRAVMQVICGIAALVGSLGVLVFFFSGFYLQEEIRLGHVAAQYTYVALCLFVAMGVSGVTAFMALIIGTSA